MFLKYVISLVITLALFSFISLGHVYAEGVVLAPDETADLLLKKGVRLVHESKYDKALATFKQVQELKPKDPAGYFFYAVVLEWVMVDYLYFDYEELFLSNIAVTIDIAEKMYAKDKKDPWVNFYLGAGYGFRGIYLINYGNWLKAFFDGIKGFGYMEDALEYDPDMADVRYGTGQYHYYKGAQADILWWIPFINVEKEKKQGMEELIYCAKYGRYTKEEALDSIAKIIYLEGDYQASLDAFNERKEKFPDYMFTQRYITLSYMGLKQWQNALDSIAEMERINKMHRYQTLSMEMDLGCLKARCYYHLGQNKKISPIVTLIADQPKDIIKRVPLYEDYLEQIEEILEMIKDD